MPLGSKQQAAHRSTKSSTHKDVKSTTQRDAAVAGEAAPASQQSTNEELAALQATEIEVLESILDADFSKVAADAQSAWNRGALVGGAKGGAPAMGTSPSSSFQVVLRPDTDSLKSSVFATVRFRLPIRYPLLPPIITVPTGNKSFRGLSTDHIKGLQDMLTSKAKQAAGSGEMIWDLISAAQEYISMHNLERFTGPNRSLEEEKRLRELKRQQEQRKKAQEESLQKSHDEQLRASKIAELIRQQSEKDTMAMQLEKERKRDASTFSPSDTQLIDYLDGQAAGKEESTSARRTEFFMDPIQHGDGKVTHQVFVGPLTRSLPQSSVFLVESVRDSSQTWQMESYTITAPHYNLTSGKRALEEVEWELDRLRMLRCDTLVNILACALISHTPSAVPSGALWMGESSIGSSGSAPTVKRLVIVQDKVMGLSADTILSHCVQLPWSRARFYLLDILNALDALHGRNLLHRDVRLGNVFLENGTGTTPATAKLARQGYARRLIDLNAANALVGEADGTREQSIPSGWEAPEVALEAKEGENGNGSKALYTKKRDLWHAGVVAIQMVFGADVAERYATPEELFSDTSAHSETIVDAHVIALLKSMVERSTRKRPTVNEARARLEETIRFEDEEQGGMSTLHAKRSSDTDRRLGATTTAKTTATPRRGMARAISEQDGGGVLRPGSFWQLGRSRTAGADLTSRYENDFEELELLGKGAYGAVYKARNRLDGRDYAIKKIRLSASADNDEKTLREITALSRLSHQNIVRYVTCWIQTQDDASALSTTTGTTMTSSMQSSVVRLPGIDDNDFMSVGHDAFSHGASRVRFGNDDDSESSDSDDDEPASKADRGKEKSSDSPKSDSASSSESDDDNDDNGADLNQSRIHQSFSLSNAPSGGKAQPRWLFIQMEYVENQTLREAIDRGLSVDESWRLFRQMIEALAHVASLGIIHRDLKPSNILMYGSTSSTALATGGGNTAAAATTSSTASSVGDIKIGDFGLATTAAMPHQPHAHDDGISPNASTFLPATDDSVDQTTEIGTNLYIAPEVLKAGASRYDHKVDVYALGIVFFEMLASQRVYQTGMERVQIIRELRLPEVRFPKGWNEAQWPAQTKIIRRMLSHKPSERPSPLDLLKSDLLPPKMEDEYIAECMRLLSMPNSTYNLQLMESLFERKETYEQREARDFTFDTGSNEGPGLDNRFIGVASQHLRTLFHRRGAVELEAPLLLPPNDLYALDEQHRPVELLDKTGKVVQLPFDLLVPFARMVSRGEQQRFKRYAIAPVYRPNLLAGGQPRSVIEVDFDIVAPEKTPAAEAEVLGVVDEILDEVPGLHGGEWVIQISHGAVLDLLLERVPVSRRDQAIAAIGKVAHSGKAAAAQGRVRLAALGLPRSITDEIDRADLSDAIDVVEDKLQRLIAVDLQPRLNRATDAIRQVIEAAKQFGVQRRFLFTPLLVSNPAFYRDDVYFVVSRGRGKRRDVLASGGRYDALLKRFASPTSTRAPAHAVGVQIALGRIALALAKHHDLLVTTGSEDRIAFAPFTPRRCDVYVASAPGLLAMRMEICRSLWAANISADLAYESALDESPELLASTCKAEGILFLVIARSRNSTVKVKSIASRTEHEVSRWELNGWLADRIQRLRGLVDAASGGGDGSVQTVSQTAMAVAGGSSGAGTAGMGGGSGGVGAERGAGSALGGTASTSSNVGSTTATILQNAGDVEVILPERQMDKRRADKHGFNDTRRGRKQAYMAPMQENAARQVARLLDDVLAGSGGGTRLPILAVDVQSAGNGSSGSFVAASPASHATSSMSSAMQASAAAGSAYAPSPFAKLGAAALARFEDGPWKLFIDSLSADERDYGRQIRRRLTEELEGTTGRRAWLVSVRGEGGVVLI